MHAVLALNRNKYAVIQSSVSTGDVRLFDLLWTFSHESTARNVVRAMQSPVQSTAEKALIGRVRLWAEQHPGEKYPLRDCV